MRREVVAALGTAVTLAGCGGGSHPAPRGTRPAATVHRSPARAPAARTAGLGPRPLAGAAARRAAVPILMYHVVSVAKPGVNYPDLFVPPAAFAAEMRALRRAGFRATTLDAVLRAWRTGSPLPRHPLVVSFDDGYLSQYTSALPVLRRLGWPGVLNLEIDNLQPGDLPPVLVRRLIRAGWEVDSHTVTHPDLTTLPASRLRYELVASGRRIRREFGVPAGNFCYPAGRFDATVERAVRAAGYRAATTTQAGWATPATDRLALPRIRVHATDTAGSLLRAVAAARPPGP